MHPQPCFCCHSYHSRHCSITIESQTQQLTHQTPFWRDWSTLNCQILIFLTKISSGFFRRREWSYKGEVVVSNPDRLSVAESELQLSLLMLSSRFALGRQLLNTKGGNPHTYGYTSMLICNWNLRLEDNSLFYFSKWVSTLKPKASDIWKPCE